MISMKSYSNSAQVALRASEPISTQHQASFNSVCHIIAGPTYQTISISQDTLVMIRPWI